MCRHFVLVGSSEFTEVPPRRRHTTYDIHTYLRHHLSMVEALSRHVCLMSDIERELHYQKLRVAALTGQLESSKPAKPKLKRHHSVM